MDVKIKLIHKEAEAPQYATDGSGCFDIKCIGSHTILNGKAGTIPTGLKFEIPKGYVMLVFSRSGHGFKHDIRLGNCVGVIDSDYRGELMIRLRADGHNYYVEHKEKIAQGIVIPFEQAKFLVVDELSDTERGEGGFGSTG